MSIEIISKPKYLINASSIMALFEWKKKLCYYRNKIYEKYHREYYIITKRILHYYRENITLLLKEYYIISERILHYYKRILH